LPVPHKAEFEKNLLIIQVNKKRYHKLNSFKKKSVQTPVKIKSLGDFG
jgi:hypothetical protein